MLAASSRFHFRVGKSTRFRHHSSLTNEDGTGRGCLTFCHGARRA